MTCSRCLRAVFSPGVYIYCAVYYGDNYICRRCVCVCVCPFFNGVLGIKYTFPFGKVIIVRIFVIIVLIREIHFDVVICFPA